MSNLSQFFTTTTSGRGGVVNSVMTVFGTSGCVTIPSAAQYVSYSALGAGGFGCSTELANASPPTFPTLGCFSFCGSGGGGGGFAYKEQPLTLSNPLTICSVVGAGGTAPVGQGGCSCIEDISPVGVLCCLSALGGQVCITGTQGGSASGGDINNCGAGVCGYVTAAGQLCNNPTYPAQTGRRQLATRNWFGTEGINAPFTLGGGPGTPINVQFFCSGGGGAGNIFGCGINAPGPCAGGMGGTGGSSEYQPLLAGSNGDVETSVGWNLFTLPSPCFYSFHSKGTNFQLCRPEMQYYAQFTKDSRFSQNKTLFSASGGAGMPTFSSVTPLCGPVPAPCSPASVGNRGTQVGPAFFYCIPGAAGGQGGGRGTGGFGGGGGEVGGNGGCGGGGGTAVYSYDLAPPVITTCRNFFNGCGGNGVTAVEYWVS